MDPINETVVEFGTDRLDQSVTGKQQIFKDGGSENRQMSIHRAILSELTPGQKYRMKIFFS
jgi:hypothetical protein